MELDLEVAAKIGVASDKLSEMPGLIRRHFPRAFHRRLATQVVSTGATAQLLDLGTPQVNHDWTVNLVTVTGADDHTVLTGTDVALYVGDPHGFTTGQYSLADLVSPSNANTVPNAVSFSRMVCWVHSNEHLYVLVYGTAVGQILTATAKIDVWKTAEVELS